MTLKEVETLVLFSQHERGEVEAYAYARGLSVSAFVRYCVGLYIDTTPQYPEDEQGEPYDGR